MSPATSRDVQMDGPEMADSGGNHSFRTYCDPRLSEVDFDRWTSVSIDNSLAAGAISHYLGFDYAIHGLFDEDLFLEDLCKGDQNFCSQTLVNAVLAWSCVSLDISPISACSTMRL